MNPIAQSESKNPCVSIGLPVYNGESFIKEAIESVLNQTFQDFELIISDNGSTDRTDEICREYAKRDKRIRYYHSEVNRGAAWNFNQIFKLSKGMYFKWLAADNAIKPEFLKCCIDVLEDEPSVVLATAKFISRSEFTDTLSTDVDKRTNNFSSQHAPRRLKEFLSRIDSPVAIWGVIRSEVLKETQLIRSFIGSDGCLLIELLLKGKFCELNKPLLLLRRHKSSYSNFKDLNQGVESVKEVKWLNPETKAKVVFPHWRRLTEYMRIVFASKENYFNKFRMMIEISFKGLLWWKILFKEVLFINSILGSIYFKIAKLNKAFEKKLEKDVIENA